MHHVFETTKTSKGHIDSRPLLMNMSSTWAQGSATWHRLRQDVYYRMSMCLCVSFEQNAHEVWLSRHVICVWGVQDSGLNVDLWTFDYVAGSGRK